MEKSNFLLGESILRKRISLRADTGKSPKTDSPALYAGDRERLKKDWSGLIMNSL